MQYVQRKLQRSVTEIRRSRSGRPKASRTCDICEQISVWLGLMSPFIHTLTTPSTPVSLPALIALVAVTAVWGVTFVQVKDAVAVYPVLPFLALRFGIATLALAPVAPAAPAAARAAPARVPAALAGGLLAAGYTLQTLGLERTSVSSAGFVTGMYVVLTPLLAYACFRLRIDRAAWAGVALATFGLAVLTGVQRGSARGRPARARPAPRSTRSRSC